MVRARATTTASLLGSPARGTEIGGCRGTVIPFEVGRAGASRRGRAESHDERLGSRGRPRSVQPAPASRGMRGGGLRRRSRRPTGPTCSPWSRGIRRTCWSWTRRCPRSTHSRSSASCKADTSLVNIPVLARQRRGRPRGAANAASSSARTTTLTRPYRVFEIQQRVRNVLRATRRDRLGIPESAPPADQRDPVTGAGTPSQLLISLDYEHTRAERLRSPAHVHGGTTEQRRADRGRQRGWNGRPRHGVDRQRLEGLHPSRRSSCSGSGATSSASFASGDRRDGRRLRAPAPCEGQSQSGELWGDELEPRPEVSTSRRRALPGRQREERRRSTQAHAALARATRLARPTTPPRSVRPREAPPQPATASAQRPSDNLCTTESNDQPRSAAIEPSGTQQQAMTNNASPSGFAPKASAQSPANRVRERGGQPHNRDKASPS